MNEVVWPGRFVCCPSGPGFLPPGGRTRLRARPVPSDLRDADSWRIVARVVERASGRAHSSERRLLAAAGRDLPDHRGRRLHVAATRARALPIVLKEEAGTAA